MSYIAANEIKKRGVSAFPEALREDGEALITVRGKGRYVIMNLEKYGALREMELARAAQEAQADYSAGRITDRTIDDHMRRIDDEV
jgi:hypothetical protein